MPSPVARFRWLRAKLHSIRNGTGAVILPPNIHKLSMDFNYRGNNGHIGAATFLRECLPRLKFHNPDVEMPVTRHRELTTGPATLTIHFCDPPPPRPKPSLLSLTAKPAAAAAKAPTTTETMDINLLNRFVDDIMAELVDKTAATPYKEPPRRAELTDEADHLEKRRETKLREKYVTRRKNRPSRPGKDAHGRAGCVSLPRLYS
ncbi:hypothetical protein DRE_03209 [Drechslerella stenobrocha 248]|uniref:Uncharacterized protein n=1 Tax=Drechslerella stenobrocha 248 TaxID=1043628 RepID=W7HVQ1_9PEZI|nr:hypothetical protein DRE_03209 [Drechslerella stenobrocha 248]